MSTHLHHLSSLLTVSLCLLFTTLPAFSATPPVAADSSMLDNTPSPQLLAKVAKQYAVDERRFQRKMQRYLQKMQWQEKKLSKRLATKDSSLSKTVFGNSTAWYDSVQQQLQHPVSSQPSIGQLNNYLSTTDSVRIAAQWLQKTSSKLGNNPVAKELQQRAADAQSQVLAASDIKGLLNNRVASIEQQLRQNNSNLSVAGLQQQTYYYGQQLAEYKILLSDSKKLTAKLLSLARETSTFKTLMAQNSYLAQLFNNSNTNAVGATALEGLQTRAMVSDNIASALSGASNPTGYMQQQMAAAQSQLDALKNKVNQLGGGSGDITLPHFKPNTQKTKTFAERLEYGINVQTQKTNYWLPTTTDIACTVGYKLNDKSVIGIGVSYKLGWGNGGINHIQLSSQGIGLRSYVDLKLKGSIWITGGYEQNYQSQFASISALQNSSAWQQSGLLGLTKKYKLGKKTNNLQLLWNFLSASQTPSTPAIVWRVGFGL